MPFQAAPFVMGTAGVAALGAGAWHVAMGNTAESWASCAGSRKGYSMVSDRSIGEIAANLYHPGQGHGNVVGEDNHTGLSPRLSHVVETMAGTQKIGDGPPNFRALRRQEVENRQPFRAQSISLGEGLRSAFAHENRGPTAAQAEAIRLEKEVYERREEERQQRLAQEQEHRQHLLTRDRLERQRRASQELEARRREGDAWLPNLEGEGPQHLATRQSAAGPFIMNGPERRMQAQHMSMPSPYMPPPTGLVRTTRTVHDGSQMESPGQIPAQGKQGMSRPPEETSALAGAPTRQWEVLGNDEGYSSDPPPGILVTTLPAEHRSSYQQDAASPEPSAMMVQQQQHNVEERLFATRPSFTPKVQTAPASAPEVKSPSERIPSPRPTPPASQAAPAATTSTSTPSAPQRPPPPAGIGISFVPDQDGNLLIAHLVPGGPAMMSGQMYIGDRLLAVGHDVKGQIRPRVKDQMWIGDRLVALRLRLPFSYYFIQHCVCFLGLGAATPTSLETRVRVQSYTSIHCCTCFAQPKLCPTWGRGLGQ